MSWQDNPTIAASVPLLKRQYGIRRFSGVDISMVEDGLTPMYRRIWSQPQPTTYPAELDPASEVWEQLRAAHDWYDLNSKSQPTLARLSANSPALLSCFNPQFFQYKDECVVINIKVESLEHMAWTIRNGCWIQNSAVSEQMMKYRRQDRQGTIYLLFSITGTEQYCALAEMNGEVYNDGTVGWNQDDKRVLQIRFIYVKNVPFFAFDLPDSIWNGMVLESRRETMKRYVTFPNYSNLLVFPAREGPCPEWPAEEGDKFSLGRDLGPSTSDKIRSKIEWFAELSCNNGPTTVRGKKIEEVKVEEKIEEIVPEIIVTPGTGELPSEPFKATEKAQPARHSVPHYSSRLEPRSPVFVPQQAVVYPQYDLASSLGIAMAQMSMGNNQVRPSAYEGTTYYSPTPSKPRKKKKAQSGSPDSIDSFGPQHHVNAWRTVPVKPQVEYRRRGVRDMHEVKVTFGSKVKVQVEKDVTQELLKEYPHIKEEYTRMLQAQELIKRRLHELEQKAWRQDVKRRMRTGR